MGGEGRKKDLRETFLNIRLTKAEAEEFRAQAAYRKKSLGEYLRDLARQDGENLFDSGKIRRGEDGTLEVFQMGNWSKVHGRERVD